MTIIGKCLDTKYLSCSFKDNLRQIKFGNENYQQWDVQMLVCSRLAGPEAI